MMFIFAMEGMLLMVIMLVLIMLVLIIFDINVLACYQFGDATSNILIS
jgi:hypothetical protein